MTRSLLSQRHTALMALSLLLAVACTAAPAPVAQPTTSQPPASPAASAAVGSGSLTDPGVTAGGAQTAAGGQTTAGGQTGTGQVKPDPSPGGPEEPVVGGPGGPAPIDPEAQWKTIQRRPDLESLRPQAWDHLSLTPDGRTLTVYFYGGVEACYGLAEVRVARTAGGVATVTLVAGTPPAIGDFACIDIAVGYKTTVQLDEPLVIDGSGGGLE